jgi:hypothetical protein
MRSRLLLAVAAALATGAHVGHAQSDRFAGGLTPGDYVNVSAGITTPVNAQGGFRDWKKGTGFNVSYVNWQDGDNGVGRAAFTLDLGYSALPLDQARFLADFTPISKNQVASASASNGSLFQLATGLRIRIPAPLIIPTINFGLGYIGWRPAKISYTEVGGATGTTKQQTRNGAQVSIGGGLERDFAQRFGIFAEADYVYGFTSLGQSAATPGGICASSSGCDVLKNTSVSTIRAGMTFKVKN